MYPLSNWLATDLGIFVPTSEHVYQSGRFVSENAQVLVALASSGQEAKSTAHELLEYGERQRADWEHTKVDLMEMIVLEKFRRNPILAAELAATDSLGLFEGNTWGDNFWGVCPIGSRKGYNHLGRILMTIRDRT